MENWRNVAYKTVQETQLKGWLFCLHHTPLLNYMNPGYFTLAAIDLKP